MRAIRWISGVRTRFLAIIFVLAMLCCPVQRTQAAGMPVIDIESILTSINNFMTEVQHINREINKWTAEAQRIATAAKALSEGDWRGGVDGLLSAATSIAGEIDVIAGTTGGMETMQALNSLWDTGMGYMDTYNSLASQWEKQVDAFNMAAESVNEGGNGFDLFNTITDAYSDTLSQGLSMINRATDAFVTSTLITTGKFAAVVNEGAGTAEKVQQYNDKITENNQTIAEKTRELQNALSNGEETTAEQLKVEIENLNKANDQLLKLIEVQSQKLAWAIDAEDQLTLARAEAASNANDRLFKSYQDRAVATMRRAVGSDENWEKFTEAVKDEMDLPENSTDAQIVEAQLANLSLYFEMRATWENNGSGSNGYGSNGGSGN